jgi:hypothetical protein
MCTTIRPQSLSAIKFKELSIYRNINVNKIQKGQLYSIVQKFRLALESNKPPPKMIPRSLCLDISCQIIPM